MEIAARYGIAVVEDAAQATGATIEGRPAGSWGHVGSLSFGGSKLLTAGRGGALLIHQPDVLQRAKLFLSRGIQQWAALSELQALALLPQLAKLPQSNAIRLRQVQYLGSSIADVPGIRLLENAVACAPAYYKVGFRFDPAQFGVNRELFVKALRAEGIAFDTGFRALQRGRSPSRFQVAGTLAEANRADQDVVVLHHPVLLAGNEAVEQVAGAIRKTYRNADRLRE
jgi:dTDP-4-amino-4,6-dideoxygalactose transaminase